MTSDDRVNPPTGQRLPAPSGRADRTISIRLTEAELAELDARIASLGLKRNRALRIAARRIGGFVEADPAELGALKHAAAQLSGVARNINQIGDPHLAAFLEERRVLGKELSRLNAQLRRMMDLAQRREDGLRRLEKARR